MANSLIIFRDELAEISLDIIYSQWAELGCNLNAKPIGKYLIDPNALLWFSLEFVHKDARLLEQIHFWLAENSNYINLPIIRKSSGNKNDARLSILADLLPERKSESGSSTRNTAVQIKQSQHCLLIRTIPLLGNDIRRLLVIWLIANPHGLTAEQIVNLTKYSKRMVYEALNNLVKTGFIYNESSIYYITNRDIWCSLLNYHIKLKFLNINDIFESIVILLRTISECIRKEIPLDSKIVEDALSNAKTKITKAAFLQHEKQKSSGDVIKLVRTIFSV